jgi:hypothetical protein
VKEMQVTQLIQDIGKCRDLLEEKDLKKISSFIGLFDKVTDEAKRQIDKYIKNDKYELDFTPYDLSELSDEIFDFVKKYQTQLKFDYGIKQLKKNKIINDKVLADFTNQQCEIMYIDRKLRETYKILAYLGLTLYLWQEFRKGGKSAV